MKIAESSIQVQSSGIQSEAFFTVKQSNIGHIFGILRNQLYSNKPLAIIREYCTNAFDAHVDAGIPQRPIEVSFPTPFKNSLTIRDFGKGLSETEVFEIFVSYGESTKRGTNEQVGMLGLGSKSAFCYVNDFTITSYHNGKKSVYLAYIDETNIGKISKITEEPTSETGLAIDIVIKTIDLSSFRQVAGTFLAEFDPKPIVKNDDRVVNQLYQEVQKSYLVKTDDYAIQTWGWNLDSVVRMGNVNYSFRIDDMGLTGEQATQVRCFRNLNVKLYAPIGSVVPSASRESLEMNDKTKSYIFKSLVDIRRNVETDTKAKFAECKSLYQFGIQYHATSQIRDVFDLAIPYKTKTFAKHYEVYYSRKDYPLIKEVLEIRRDARTSFVNQERIVINADQTIFVYTGNVPQNTIRQRILNSGLSLKNAYILKFACVTDSESVTKDPEWFGANFVDVSTLPYVKVKGQSAGSFAVSEVYSYASGRRTLRDTWVSNNKSLQNSEGVYVEIKRFLPVSNHPNGDDIKTMESFEELLTNLYNLEIKVPNIYGVKYCDIDKLGSGWVELTDYIQQALYNLSDEQIEKFNKCRISSQLSEEWRSAFSSGMVTYDKDLTRLKEIIDQYYSGHSYIQNNGVRIGYLTNRGYDVYLDTYKECEQLVSNTLTKYPILRNLFEYDRKSTSPYAESINKYWQNVNNYLKSQDYLQSEGLLD